MDDESNKPADEHQEPEGPPAPWERRPPQDQPEDLRHTLAGGDSVEYTADESQQASYLADEQQSLQSRISGGGLDQGAESDSEVTRLCLGCGKVTTFVQGQCTNCGYKMSGAGGTAPPEMTAPGFAAGTGVGAAVRGVVIAVVVIAVLVVGFLIVRSCSSASPDSGQPAVASVDARSGSAPAQDGALDSVTINTVFHGELAGILEDGNGAWTNAGVDAYVYRYSIFNDLVPSRTQVIHVSAYVGGPDAEVAIESPKDQIYREAVAPYIDKLDERDGVNVTLFLLYTAGDEEPAAGDVYIRYGYYYGKEHWGEIEKIVNRLESIRNEEGQYPLGITDAIVRPKIRTYGGMRFISNGYGYLPVFKTDSAGEVIMGSGKGIASLQPEECTGYYLLCYTESESAGLDLYGPEGLNYYREYISPFPYQPKSTIRNVPLEPDGKPDGIAAVVKNGELMQF